MVASPAPLFCPPPCRLKHRSLVQNAPSENKDRRCIPESGHRTVILTAWSARQLRGRPGPTSRAGRAMSALPPKADMCGATSDVRFGPIADTHSITSSARARNAGCTVTPIAPAVFTLMTNSNLVGCSTGISAGFVPFRILSAISAALPNNAGKFGP
jgi:hypothetical protein